ncbi:MAG: WD40 repeat domain-containing protein [Sphingobacteriaceae bacterium]|nr:WD40 repeat domain-containing protein [Sphingobacteriaceae bacterium]
MRIKLLFLFIFTLSLTKGQDEPLFILQGHSGGINSIALSPDGKTLVSGSKDETIRFWDLEKKESIKSIVIDHSSVKRVSFNKDASKLLISIYERFAEIDIKSGKKKLSKKKSHTAFAETSIYSEAGDFILTSSWRDNTLSIWKSSNFKKVIDLKEIYWVDNALFNKKGNIVYSGGHDNQIKAWDVTTGNMIYALAGHDDWVYDIALSSDEKFIYSAGFDKLIKVWDLNSRKNIATLKGHSEGVVCIDISPDGKWLASGGTDKEIIIWNLSDNSEVKRIKAHADAVTDLKFSKDSKTLYSASLDKTIKGWNLLEL